MGLNLRAILSMLSRSRSRLEEMSPSTCGSKAGRPDHWGQPILPEDQQQTWLWVELVGVRGRDVNVTETEVFPLSMLINSELFNNGLSKVTIRYRAEPSPLISCHWDLRFSHLEISSQISSEGQCWKIWRHCLTFLFVFHNLNSTEDIWKLAPCVLGNVVLYHLDHHNLYTLPLT